MIPKEKYQNVSLRLANPKWTQPTASVRLSLVTCRPNVTNKHRFPVVAAPVYAPKISRKQIPG